jgi:AcrR family transcriptional regulator
MGRPRRHLQPTAAALLTAAEALVEVEGVSALTVRRVAAEVGTSTRAVYATYGSKEALLVALGRKAFEILDDELSALPTTSDPVGDLVEIGLIFRRFTIEHPTLFAIGIQRRDVSSRLSPEIQATAAGAFGKLEQRFRPLEASGRLAAPSTRSAACTFHALCEGLASLESRSMLPKDDEEASWREALAFLLSGLTT